MSLHLGLQYAMPTYYSFIVNYYWSGKQRSLSGKDGEVCYFLTLNWRFKYFIFIMQVASILITFIFGLVLTVN